MLPDISYYEYKFLVRNEQLDHVRNLLSSFYGGSDPYPEGIVDTIYFDDLSCSCFQQCQDGDAIKEKYRIRGYGNREYSQIHYKRKNLSGVGKLKSAIEPIKVNTGDHVSWNLLKCGNEDSFALFDEIRARAQMIGYLVPVIRVKYYRYRFRVNDYRITLDTRVEVTGMTNGVHKFKLDYGVLPHHVLEVKTESSRPYLPLFGAVRLPQISFSKFYLGLNLLCGEDAA